MTRLLATAICSAIEEEIGYLRNALGSSEGMLFKPLGIGFLNAALNLEKLILETKTSIEQIVFLGTCGSYNTNLQIGDIVSISSTALLNLGMLQGISYSPLQDSSSGLDPHALRLHSVTTDSLRMTSSLRASEGGEAIHNTLCLSSLEISRDPKIAELVCKKYSEQKYIVENMELYGVAQVCDRYKIKLTALLGVTNYIDANAHEDWLQHNTSVAEKVCDITCALGNFIPSPEPSAQSL